MQKSFKEKTVPFKSREGNFSVSITRDRIRNNPLKPGPTRSYRGFDAKETRVNFIIVELFYTMVY